MEDAGLPHQSPEQRERRERDKRQQKNFGGTGTPVHVHTLRAKQRRKSAPFVCSFIIRQVFVFGLYCDSIRAESQIAVILLALEVLSGKAAEGEIRYRIAFVSPVRLSVKRPSEAKRLW